MSQSQEDSPVSDKMDISDTIGSQQSPHSSDFDDALDDPDSGNTTCHSNLNNEDVLSLSYSPRSCLTSTESHPLMLPNDSCPGSLNQNVNYPDLVPESSPLRLGAATHPASLNCNSVNYEPVSHTATIPYSHQHFSKFSIAQNSKLKYDEREHGSIGTPSLESYTDQLPDFPDSPSQLRRMPHIQLPIELCALPDASSDSEPDLSMYQTELVPSAQAVSLHYNVPPSPRGHRRRKIKVVLDDLPQAPAEDTSSVDTLSDQLDIAPTNASSMESLSSEMYNEGSDDGSPTTRVCPEVLPEYTAAEERRNVRSWQMVTLPDGCIREIDMKVIEPYKRVLSHGGYLQAGGHNAIVVFGACFLPDKSRIDYNYVMDNLFLYVVRTLEQLVTEDYVLVYLHGSASKGCIPPFPWLRRCYQLLDRRLRKSLKQLYVVHPTFWLKTLLWMSRPFISAKFWRKLIYVNSLEELYTLVPVKKAAVPERVKQFDSD